MEYVTFPINKEIFIFEKNQQAKLWSGQVGLHGRVFDSISMQELATNIWDTALSFLSVVEALPGPHLTLFFSI